MQTQKRFTKMTPEQQAEHGREMIAKFDAEFPIGKTVWYWHSLPFGPVVETRITHGAWLLGSGDPVCKVAGVSGGVSIWHITEPDQSRPELITQG